MAVMVTSFALPNFVSTEEFFFEFTNLLVYSMLPSRKRKLLFIPVKIYSFHVSNSFCEH